MGKREIAYKDAGGLRADQVQSLVLDVASKYFKGDEHQREVEASRAVFDFLVLCGPFENYESARNSFVSERGPGKSHASAMGNSGGVIPYSGYHNRSRGGNLRVR